ncbi:facilitated glucose transporter [Gordonia sp. CPCC 205333]|uniref:facilitated glucose transporter n=1 Tax=Gordonia sp. CPCC 205333 TaxID=3140790 RepID=UPI003AF3A107
MITPGSSRTGLSRTGFSPAGLSRFTDAALLVFLIADGFIVGVLSVSLTYLRVGDTAVPIGIAIAVVGNSMLVWLASRFTDSPLRWGPLLAWVVVLLVSGVTGPGGDVLLITNWRAMALLVGGVVGPAFLGWRGLLNAN